MNKRKIYFVQTGCVFNNEHFLPYAVGIIAAYAFNNPTIKANYCIEDIIYKCDNFEQTLESIKAPCVVAFSNYMWNFKFNLKLAEKIKEIYPDCLIIFGGHQISDTVKWLTDYPFVDVAVCGEGEKTFADILLSFCQDKDFSEIANISYRKDEKIFNNKEESYTEDINNIPSPYLTGIFDKILKNNTDKFAAVIETTRGCPYHCAYCDWGDYNLAVRRFEFDRIKKEIEYLAKNSVVFVVLADSNFGMFESDEAIADEFVRAKKEFGYPKAVEIAFAKHSPDRVFSINKKLYENDMSRGATLSMQTLDPTALKNIGRENITKEKFSQLLRLYSENNIPSYTELILGLPGETYESFCEGIEYLLKHGQHNSIHVFYCEVLPNAIMSSEGYIKKHGIKTLERDFELRNGVKSDGIQGLSRIITATDSLGQEDFLKAIIFAFTIQAFHNFGLCRAIALYFHYEKNMPYSEFYNRLISWLYESQDTISGRIFKGFTEIYEKSVKGTAFEIYENSLFGNTKYNLSDGAFLEFIRVCDSFYEELKAFLYTLSEDRTVIDELLEFQKAIIRKPDNKPCVMDFEYDWVSFYTAAVKLGKADFNKKKIRLKISPSEEYNDLLSYSQEIAVKGRRISKSIVLSDSTAFVAEDL